MQGTTAPAPTPPAAPGRGRHWLRWAGCILLAGLCARLTLFWVIQTHAPERSVQIDTASYWGPARALVQALRFSEGPSPTAPAELVRTPGYPLYLAGCFVLAGEGQRLPVAGQIVLSMLCVVAVGWLGLRCGGRAVALLAMSLVAFDLVSIELANLLLSETLFTVALVAGMACGWRLASGPRYSLRWAILLAGSIAAMAFIRPIAYYLVVPVTVWAVYTLQRGGLSAAQLFKLAVALVAPVALSLGAWQWRNHAVAGTWQFSQITFINMGLYRGAGILAHERGLDWSAAQAEVIRLAGITPQQGSVERGRRLAHVGSVLMREHPAALVYITLKGLLTTLAPNGRSIRYLATGSTGGNGPAGDLWSGGLHKVWEAWVIKQPQWVVLFLFECLLLSVQYLGLLLAVPALWQLARPQRDLLWLALLMFVYFWCLGAGPEAYSRFRGPLVPLIALASALGWSLFVKKLTKRFCR